jgi:transcriptional regulator with XRE-family HTH domain
MEGRLTPRLKQLRHQRKLTQVKMADLLGLTRSTYVHYELGWREPPISQLVEIAAKLGVSLDFLAGVSDFVLTVDSALKFGVLKKLRSVRTEDMQPYTVQKYSPPKVAENPPDGDDGYNIP